MAKRLDLGPVDNTSDVLKSTKNQLEVIVNNGPEDPGFFSKVQEGIDALSGAISVMEDAEAFPGECQESVPFARLYRVAKEGKLYWSCEHNPPHWFKD